MELVEKRNIQNSFRSIKIVYNRNNNTLERNRLANDISRYKLKDTFNTNKLGFFLRVLPNKTLQLKGEKFGSTANATGKKNLYRAFTSHK